MQAELIRIELNILDKRNLVCWVSFLFDEKTFQVAEHSASGPLCHW
jgi:hypothetical protein